MTFVNASRKDEKYDLCDVFGRDKIFYKNSTVRIVGWETPVSIIYCDGEEIKIRFKKSIEKYAEGFEDKEFECDPSILESELYETMLSFYNAEKSMRRLSYAIEQYKKAAEEFTAVKLFQNELEDKLCDEELLTKSYPLTESNEFFQCYNALYNSLCYWFPVDVDAIITDFSNRTTISHDEAIIAFANGKKKYGRIGFDGKFYSISSSWQNSENYEVFSLNNGVKKCETPDFIKESQKCVGYEFLRDYIVTPNYLCYNYNGEFLPEKSKHHKNVKLTNDLIRLLWKQCPNTYSDNLYLNIVIPKEFVNFNIDDVERVIVPHLVTKKSLNQSALTNFLGVKKVIKKAGLENNFEVALRNIIDLNKSKIYGGTKRNICSKQLLENLQKLHKKLGVEKMATVLQNEVQLKMEIAKINGTTIVEYVISNNDFMQIKKTRRVPKELKKDKAWGKLQPGMLVVFSNNYGERYCTITTKTKSGLKLNRA